VQFVWIGVAGSLGAVSRYWLDGVVSRWATWAFPWGTFVVNISGCFVIGFLSVVLTGKFLAQPALRTAVLVGFVGAYTTFSTFAYQSFQLARGGAVALAFANLAGSVLAGLVAVWLGTTIGGAL
jgi:fluoride exporter